MNISEVERIFNFIDSEVNELKNSLRQVAFDDSSQKRNKVKMSSNNRPGSRSYQNRLNQSRNIFKNIKKLKIKQEMINNAREIKDSVQ